MIYLISRVVIPVNVHQLPQVDILVQHRRLKVDILVLRKEAIQVHRKEAIQVHPHHKVQRCLKVDIPVPRKEVIQDQVQHRHKVDIQVHHHLRVDIPDMVLLNNPVWILKLNSG